VWSETRLVFVGTWVPRVLKEIKLFLAHFYTVTTVTKPDSMTDTFFQFLVLKVW